MSSSIYHPKWHSRSHHTNPTAGFPDSALDPIGNQSSPFQGNLYVAGTLSAQGIILTGGLSAQTITQSTIYAQVLSAGGYATTIKSVTGNYQTLNTDYVVFANGGALSSIVTLPPASAVPNQEYVFKRTSTTAVTLSVAQVGTLIEAQYDSILLNTQNTVVILISYQNFGVYGWAVVYNSY